MSFNVASRVIAIDPGNDSTKYAYRDAAGQIVTGDIDNVAGPAIELDIPPARGEQRELLHISLADPPEGYEGEWFLGPLALTQLQEDAIQDRSRRRANSIAANLIAPAALAMACEDREQVVLGISTTIRDYAVESPLLAERLRGRRAVRFHLGPLAGSARGPMVDDVRACPQSVASGIDELLDDRGNPRHLDWLMKPLMIVNIGHGQINYAILAPPKLQYVREAADSLDIGFWRVAEAVRDYLNGEPWYYRATIPQLKQAVIEKRIWLDGEEIDLRPVVDGVISNTVERLYRSMEERVPPALFRQSEVVIVAGAPARMVAGAIQERFRRLVHVGADPKYADARGTLKRTEMILRPAAADQR